MKLKSILTILMLVLIAKCASAQSNPPSSTIAAKQQAEAAKSAYLIAKDDYILLEGQARILGVLAEDKMIETYGTEGPVPQEVLDLLAAGHSAYDDGHKLGELVLYAGSWSPPDPELIDAFNPSKGDFIYGWDNPFIQGHLYNLYMPNGQTTYEIMNVQLGRRLNSAVVYWNVEEWATSEAKYKTLPYGYEWSEARLILGQPHFIQAFSKFDQAMDIMNGEEGGGGQNPPPGP